MRWKPHPYQLRAAKFLVENQYAGLFLDPGLGKTSIFLAAFKALRKVGFVQKALVLAPLRVAHLVWPAEVLKWDDFRDLKVGVLHGPNKDKVLQGDHDIHVLNYDGLRWFAQQTKKPKYGMLVADESHKVKAVNTQRFKLLKPMLPGFSRRVILTGTPRPNSLLDLFGQMYVVDLGASLGKYITHYRNTYFNPSGYGGYTWVPQAGAEQRIHAILAPRTLRMSAEEFLQLPPLIESDIRVQLPTKAYRLYEEMEREFMLELDDGEVTAANAAVKLGYLRQIANGGLYTDASQNRWQPIHDAKTEAVVDIVEELAGAPAIIVYEFRHDLARLQTVFKEAPHIGGDTSPKETDRIVASWNRGEVPVLLAHPQSVGHGLNMQESGSAVIWYSLTYSFSNYDQMIRRIWRQGQKAEKVFVYHILADRTVDEAVLGVLRSKRQGQKALFDALTEYRDRRKQRGSK